MLAIKEGLTMALDTLGSVAGLSSSCSLSSLLKAYVELMLRRAMMWDTSAAAVSGGRLSSRSASWLEVSCWGSPEKQGAQQHGQQIVVGSTG
jgi:hypothetical protein